MISQVEIVSIVLSHKFDAKDTKKSNFYLYIMSIFVQNFGSFTRCEFK